MNDRAVALLEQYEIEVLRTRKGRGAILCDTQQGCLIFKEYTGREEQLRLQEQVLKHLEVFYDTDSGLFFLMDNHSVNHTYINNKLSEQQVINP